MIRKMSGCLLAAAAVLFFWTPARAQLTLEVELADLETFLSNNTALVISSDGYEIQSAAGILDPIHWRSIDDSAAANPAAVTAALGNGALSFDKAGGSSSHVLAEINPFSQATWQPGTRWSIGFPFGTSLDQFHSRPFDATWEYVSPGNPNIIAGEIRLIPVPEPAAMSLAAIAVIGLALARRRCH